MKAALCGVGASLRAYWPVEAEGAPKPEEGVVGTDFPADRAFAFAASSSLFLGAALVSSDRSSRPETPAISSTAATNAAWFAFEGLLKPLIFLTNCNEAARISSSVIGGSKLKRFLMFLHMTLHSR